MERNFVWPFDDRLGYSWMYSPLLNPFGYIPLFHHHFRHTLTPFQNPNEREIFRNPPPSHSTNPHLQTSSLVSSQEISSTFPETNKPIKLGSSNSAFSKVKSSEIQEKKKSSEPANETDHEPSTSTGVRKHSPPSKSTEEKISESHDHKLTIKTKKLPKSHILIHNGGKHFVCSMCQKSLSSKHGLKYHIGTHFRKHRYKCNKCSFESNYEKRFKEHYNIHTGERPYQCDFCPRRFSTQIGRNNHIRFKHREVS